MGLDRMVIYTATCDGYGARNCEGDFLGDGNTRDEIIAELRSHGWRATKKGLVMCPQCIAFRKNEADK